MYQTIMDLCKEKGVTCYSMCQSTGIKQNAISNLKQRPNAGVSLELAIKLSDYFCVPIETFQRKKE